MSTTTQVLIGSVVVIGTSVCWLRWYLYPKPIPGIPHRPITSWLGDMPELGKVIQKDGVLGPNFWDKYAVELGPIYQVFIGPSTMVVLSDVHEIEDVLLRGRSKHLDSGTRITNIFRGISPNAQIALTMNDLWKKHRRLATPAMSPKYLKPMTPSISDGALALVGYWKEKMAVVRKKGGNCFDCSIDFHLCTMDVITELSFAEKVNGVSSAQTALGSSRAEIDAYGGTTFPDIKGNRFHQAVTGHYKRMTGSTSIPPFLQPLYWVLVKLTPSFRTDDYLIRETVRSRVRQARIRAANVAVTGGSEMPDCALDLIIEKDEKEPNDRYEEHEIVDEMMDYVFAGYDTTASALTFAVKYLMNHPSVQYRLHDELTSNLIEPENRPLTYDEVSSSSKTPYLDAVVQEILRVALVGSAGARQVQEDVVILGKVVPKGAEILFLTGFAGFRATKSWGAQKAAESTSFKPTKGLWDDHDVFEFKPERWIVDGPDGKPMFSPNQGYSVPFGFGAKSCFGQRLAILELKVIIATLSLAFFFDKVPDELNGDDLVEVLTRKPKQSYVSLQDWEDVK